MDAPKQQYAADGDPRRRPTRNQIPIGVFLEVLAIVQHSDAYGSEGHGSTIRREGSSLPSVQRLLGCRVQTACGLQIEMARLRPFEVIYQALSEDRDLTEVRPEAFLLLTIDSRMHAQSEVLPWQ